jgi:SAM-dependent methyltransferase
VHSQHELYSGVLLEYWQKGEPIYPEEQFLLSLLPADKNAAILEAGCGGGRLLFYLEKQGYQHLHGFDYVQKMVQYASEQARLNGSTAQFSHQALPDLSNYPSGSFDACLCMQQLLSFVPHADIPASLREIHRVLRPGGCIMGVTLHYGGLWYSPLLSVILKTIRFFQGRQLPAQSIPWMVIQGRFNWRFWRSDETQNYWFHPDELSTLLQTAGFTPRLLLPGHALAQQLQLPKPHPGWLFFVADKKIGNENESALPNP